MKMPVQPPKIDPDHTALAPYNFVPLPERVILMDFNELPDQDRYDPGSLSGYLDCELTTSSPIYIRGGVKPEDLLAQTEPAAQFFYVDREDQPVIPGSSLRGMLRTLVEIVSYSKVSAVTNKRLVYRAVGDVTTHGHRYRDQLMQEDRDKYYTPLMKGGYMEKDGSDWYIRPAQEVDGATFALIKIDQDLFKTLRPVKGARNALEVYIQTSPYEYQPVRGGFLHVRQARVLAAYADPRPNARPATIAKSGWMNSKRNEAVIYAPDEHADRIQLEDEQLDAYREQLSAEQKKLLGNQGVLVKGQPVFYLPDPLNPRRVVAFGHCRMLRIPYPASPRDLVPAQIRDSQYLDLSEILFGFTRPAWRKDQSLRERSYAGRVFVSDAQIASNQRDLWLDPQRTIMPKILGSPKPTTFQHYLVQTQPNRYPVGQTRDGKTKYELRLADYAADTVLRGNKFYWHKGAVTKDDLADPDPVKGDDTQHTHIQPLRAGVKFRFRIDFENLRGVELGALLWVLGVAADERYRLKLGMGKPLGMGAIRVQAELHLIDRQQRYANLFTGEDWRTGEIQTGNQAGSVTAEFERFVLTSLGRKEEKRLEEMDRIQDLLHLLSWPGPDPEQTRYLEIEHEDRTSKKGKRNEYRDRPVLPRPAAVLASGKPGGKIKWPAPEQSAPPDRGNDATRQPGERRGVVKKFGLGPRQDYGFIRYQDDQGQEAEIFVHKNELVRGLSTLQVGQRVVFSIGPGMRGDQAKKVRLD